MQPIHCMLISELARKAIGVFYFFCFNLNHRTQYLCEQSGMSVFDFNRVLLNYSDAEAEVGELEFLQELQEDVVQWFQYCRMFAVDAAIYYRE
ncbi:Hypothetical predicted protein [Olea europaea subsp. europaea]|uniref:Uncharacterized protein n=1 Tax=Olea europaea subsp. europaea TaxID=158383 RepID=A0A8S0USJ6_OLEEU|nr:Hypothetical predicted protein [Olea europaea subsp. europaea]